MTAAESTSGATAPSGRRVRKQRVVSGAFDAGAGASLLAAKSSEDEEHVIMRLSLTSGELDMPGAAPGSAEVSGPAAAAGGAPGPYNAVADSTFVSHPSAVMPLGTPMSDLSGMLPMTIMPAPGVAAAVPSPVPPAAAVGGGGVHPLGQDTVAGVRAVRLLTEFQKKCEGGEWPQSTSVHCHWCCHRFSNVPVGLPVRHVGGVYHVVGCFCSLECAAAHNFATRNSVDECLNRHGLLNALARQLGLSAGGEVRPAPDRVVLSMFGGPMTIDEFRAHTSGGRLMVVNMPPMQAVTQQAEEVSESDLRSEYKYIPLDGERVTRIQEKHRLRRTKPLIDFENTLDHSMKLKIISSATSRPGGMGASITT